MFDDILIGSGCALVPVPRILKRLDLRGSLSAIPLREQDVIAGVRIERRVEVDEINRLVGDVPPEHVEVVADIDRTSRVATDAELRKHSSGWRSRLTRVLLLRSIRERLGIAAGLELSVGDEIQAATRRSWWSPSRYWCGTTASLIEDLQAEVDPVLAAAKEKAADERAIALVEESLPVFIYFEDYGILDSAIYLPRFLVVCLKNDFTLPDLL